MDFLGIGGGEILLIILIVLFLWGPGRVVEISRSLGQLIHSLKNTTSELTTQITRELEEQKKEISLKPSPPDKPGPESK